MTVLGTGVRRGMAAGVAAGLLLAGTAGTAEAVATAAPAVRVCGLDPATFTKPSLALAYQKLHKVYYAGGSWSGFTLKAGNSTPARCAGVLPVVVFGSRGRPLRRGDVRMQWRTGRGGWHGSAMVAENGVLMGLVGPAQGLSLAARGKAAVPLRMRFSTGAPTGQWVTMAIGYAPVTLEGETAALPVGISDPRLFRVLRQVRRPSGAPQLAETGGPPRTAVAAGASLLCLGGGAGLLALSRRRRVR
ncbi:hypothetical protein ACEZDB_19925 [Streptacidiphilus sp. N1-3]|uniref:Gram-positive cocci surface proteins LPxTG domain-containing protein n=1 Tax=Streptacidiphilus alkalitolerans TaxID=3342712 RepID=A0ABV6X4G6_9ACTN